MNGPHGQSVILLAQVTDSDFVITLILKEVEKIAMVPKVNSNNVLIMKVVKVRYLRTDVCIIIGITFRSCRGPD